MNKKVFIGEQVKVYNDINSAEFVCGELYYISNTRTCFVCLNKGSKVPKFLAAKVIDDKLIRK
jgi:hypothetical protein